MSIFVCGDTHGTFDRDKITTQKWKKQKSLTQSDYLIILGDTGIIWNTNPIDKEELNLIEWYNNKRMKVLFIDGNHENFERLNNFPETNMFGDKVGQISDNIYHLKRGRVYTIDGKKIFTFGGGSSIDKGRRRNRVSWWEEELPSYSEYLTGKENLEKNNFKVDYILTHSCSTRIFNKMYLYFDLKYKEGEEKSLRDYFDWIEDNVNFKQWHFGHFHYDKKIDDKHYLWYNKVSFHLD